MNLKRGRVSFSSVLEVSVHEAVYHGEGHTGAKLLTSQLDAKEKGRGKHWVQNIPFKVILNALTASRKALLLKGSTSSRLHQVRTINTWALGGHLSKTIATECSLRPQKLIGGSALPYLLPPRLGR
jgi:hypothetical protein